MGRGLGQGLQWKCPQGIGAESPVLDLGPAGPQKPIYFCLKNTSMGVPVNSNFSRNLFSMNRLYGSRRY